MAKRVKSKRPKSQKAPAAEDSKELEEKGADDEADEGESLKESEPAAKPATAKRAEKPAPKDDDEDDEEDAKKDVAEDEDESAPIAADGSGDSIDKGEDAAGETALAKVSDEEEEEGEAEAAAGQLGTDRYVLAGFFAAGMLGAYVVGRALQGIWIAAANKDWFSQNFARLTAVQDDDKGMYSLILAGLIAIVVVFRTYKRPDVRAWCDEVASELTKVKWPSRKEVSNSTLVVIAASAAATLYLALLDRLWAFVTNLVYGDGS